MNTLPPLYRAPVVLPRALRERPARILESHISDIWLREAVPGRSFITSDGETITLLSTGRPNRGDGPDFEKAAILRGGVALTGSIEIHRSERDWERHGHEGNPRYAKVILHVVLEGRSMGSQSGCRRRLTIFLAENLRGQVSAAWGKTRSNLASPDRFPLPEEACSHAPERVRRAMVALASAERFRRKVERVMKRYAELTRRSPLLRAEEIERQLVQEFVGEALGYGGNKEPMRCMAQAFPSAFWREAGPLSFLDRGVILLGASGVLGAFGSRVGVASALRVRSRWDGLRNALAIRPIPFPTWNLGGMRPGNAPHNRLLALAALLPKLSDPEFHSSLVRACVGFPADPVAGAGHFERLLELQEEEFLPDYGCPAIGRERIHEIIVNAIAPCLYIAGGAVTGGPLSAAAATLYFSFPSAARNRAIAQSARRLSLPPDESSGNRQGLLEVRSEYCEKSRCAECLLRQGI